MPTKTCSLCKEERPVVDFYQLRKGSEQRQSQCKKCENKRKVKSPYFKKYFGSEAGRSAWNKASETARAKYPEKWSARSKLRYAVRTGKLKKLPCEVCQEPKTHGHHDDYSKPLEVRWLCQKHHREHHESLRKPTMVSE